MLDIEKTLREPKLIPYRKGPQNFAVCLKLSIRQLVSRLVLAIVILLTLHCVVSQMDNPVLQVIRIVLLGASSQISFRIEKALQSAIDRRKQSKGSDVEFAPIYE